MSDYKRYFDSKSQVVFITFVTYQRQNILIENIEILRNAFEVSKSKYNFKIIAITIMKNHCHLLLQVFNSNEISKIIRDIKYNFSKNISNKYINKELSLSAQKRGEKGIWQRRHYDHIIRDEVDLYKHIDYIHYNSIKHYKILPKNWEYSSFKNFVKNNYYDENWCNLNDKNDINSMDLEWCYKIRCIKMHPTDCPI